MWNTSNSKVILRWDQVHALENESEVTGYKVDDRCHSAVLMKSVMDQFYFVTIRICKYPDFAANEPRKRK